MFESDDYDQILSQLDYQDPCEKLLPNNKDVPYFNKEQKENNSDQISTADVDLGLKDNQTNINLDDSNLSNGVNVRETKSSNPIPVSSVPNKRKILNSYFDYKSKRKFPGPAGLLTSPSEGVKDESICEMELLSQDVRFIESHIHDDVFETKLWKRLLEDTKCFHKVNTISAIKHQASAGTLPGKKAHIVTAFIESVDRSSVEPLITLRDETGDIKCTLHRDAWTTFSPYIVAEYCALVVWRPSVLTIGRPIKNNYLIITLSNIWAIYSTGKVTNGDEELLEGFQKVYDEDFTIIKTNKKQYLNAPEMESIQDSSDILEGLDSEFTDAF